MKISLSQKAKQIASALVLVMVMGGILCLFVVYYLSLVEQQNKLNARSQAWNIAIAVSEAGIEEGLEAINNVNGFNATEWAYDGTYYIRTNSLVGDNSYVVYIKGPTATTPEITSRAYVPLPAFAAAPSLTMFAQVNSGIPAAGGLSRAVRVTCSKNPSSLFTAAMVSKHAIDLKGNGVLTDSYDSSNPAKSTDGRYDSNKYKGDRGDVATNDGIIVGVGNANIYGKLHTGPDGGFGMGPNGGVGTHDWQAQPQNVGKLEPGYFAQDANFTFPETSLPTNTASYLTPQPGDVVVTLHPITSNSTTSGTCPIPLPWGGVATNVTAYSTTSSLPNPLPPGLKTNTLWITNSPVQPFPVPAGTITNIVGYNLQVSPPNPAPAGTITNTIWHNNMPSLPSPVPSGTTTNYHWVKDHDGAPAPGTYMPGTLTQNGSHWDYASIDGYNYPTYTYSVPIFRYNFPTYTYTYPSAWTYTYNLYQTNTVTVTNHYDNVLYANQKYVSSALTNSSIVMGPNVELVLPNGLTGAENLFFNYTTPVDTTVPGLTIYAGGTSASINGNQYINPSGFAGSLIIYCAPTVTSFTLNGNGQFTGVLVAPNADLDMNGGGASPQDFCGSLMVNNAKLNGHFSFHWDEALGNLNNPNSARYLVQTWNEIK